MDVGTGQRQDTGNPIALLAASVANLGQPSIADEWSVEVVTKEGAHIDRRPSVIFQDKPIEMGYVNGKTQIYDPKDALYLKTASDPVTTGAKRTGFLIFDFPKMSFQPGTIFRLKCKDIAGNIIVSPDFSLAGPSPDVMPYYTGTTEPKQH